jgi:hypothetical protein
MSAAFTQPDQPHLRERSRVARAPGPAECRSVLIGIGNVQYESVDGHEAPRAQPRARRAALRAGDRNPLEQDAQWLGSQPLTRLRDRPRGRDRPVIPP